MANIIDPEMGGNVNVKPVNPIIDPQMGGNVEAKPVNPIVTSNAELLGAAADKAKYHEAWAGGVVTAPTAQESKDIYHKTFDQGAVVTAPTAQEAKDIYHKSFDQGAIRTSEPLPTTDNTVSGIENFLSNWQNTLNAMFKGIDFASLGIQSNDYLQQLMTGQTVASKALQAKEAKAMALGTQNLLNQISATAAGAGITGGELSRLYGRGMQTISGMLGDFALNNIIRMGDNQQKGFDGIMKMFGEYGADMSSFTSAYGVYQNANQNARQWEQTYGIQMADRMWDVVQNNPAAASIYQKMLNGQPVTQQDIDFMQNAIFDSRTMTDVANEVAKWEDLGIDTDVRQMIGADGNPVVNSRGEPVYEVVPKSNIVVDPVTGRSRMEFVPASGGAVGTGVSASGYTIDGYADIPADKYSEWKTLALTMGGLALSDPTIKSALLSFAARGNVDAISDIAKLYSKDGQTLLVDWADMSPKVQQDIANVAQNLTKTFAVRRGSGESTDGWNAVAGDVVKFPDANGVMRLYVVRSLSTSSFAGGTTTTIEVQDVINQGVFRTLKSE